MKPLRFAIFPSTSAVPAGPLVATHATIEDALQEISTIIGKDGWTSRLSIIIVNTEDRSFEFPFFPKKDGIWHFFGKI